MSKPLSTILYLRFDTYHKKKLSLDLEKFPPTSNAIRFHILHAHFQAYIWYCAPIKRSIDIAPEMCGYANEDDELVPIITDEDILSEKLPMPYNCKNASQTKGVSVTITIYHVLSIVNVEKHVQMIELNILT